MKKKEKREQFVPHMKKYPGKLPFCPVMHISIKAVKNSTADKVNCSQHCCGLFCSDKESVKQFIIKSFRFEVPRSPALGFMA